MHWPQALPSPVSSLVASHHQLAPHALPRHQHSRLFLGDVAPSSSPLYLVVTQTRRSTGLRNDEVEGRGGGRDTTRRGGGGDATKEEAGADATKKETGALMAGRELMGDDGSTCGWIDPANGSGA